MEGLAEAKRVMRTQILQRMRTMTAEDIGRESAQVAEKCFGIEQLKDAVGVSIYVSMEKELGTSPIISWLFRAKKRVFVPCITGKTSPDMRMVEIFSPEEISRWSCNRYGIREMPRAEVDTKPDVAESGLIDVVFCPGVAFDTSCNRLGHGKGYYDCFLSRAGSVKKPFTIGLSLSPQVVPLVPCTDFDVPLDVVVCFEKVHKRASQSSLKTADV
ncbi:5-formyltetrahydrofolate cyclo-ligase [Diplonema papillatum]|nr:5-formyltetrahydrofolate cyclo-ligase [Diplonema papillatum]